MRSREVPNGFWIFDNPDCLIIVSYKDGSLRFPFRMPDRGTATPAFLHAIRAAGLRVFGPTSLVADPTSSRRVLLLGWRRAERCETANKQENKSNPAPGHLSASRLRNPPPRLPIGLDDQSLAPCDVG